VAFDETRSEGFAVCVNGVFAFVFALDFSRFPNRDYQSVFNGKRAVLDDADIAHRRAALLFAAGRASKHLPGVINYQIAIRH
jgi:hypothetical protein